MKKISNSTLEKLKNDLIQQYGEIEIDFSKCLNKGAPNSSVFVFTVKSDNSVKALKILNNSYSPKEDFLLEKRAMEMATSEKVIKFEHSNECDTYYFFTFPFIEGDSLERTMKNREFSDEEVEAFLYEMIDVISSLNKDGVTHQDIKPANIVHSQDGTFVLIDLGIALFNFSDPTLKKAKGPINYLSPEQFDLYTKRNLINQCKVGYASDLYSLGLIGIEMVIGEAIKSFVEPSKMHELSDKIESDLETADSLKVLLLALIANCASERVYLLNSIREGITEGESSNFDETLWTQQYHIDTPAFIIKNNFFEVHDPSKFGYIISADSFKSEETILAQVDEMRKQGVLIMVDPRTMRLDNDNIGYLSERDYSDDLNIVENVLEFEMRFNPNFYIAPYFCVSNMDDNAICKNIQAHQKFTNIRDDITKSNTYFGIAIKADLLRNKAQLDILIDVINFNDNIQKVYVLFEAKKTSNHPIKDTEALQSIRRFIKLIGMRKEVFWSFADITALYFLGSGLSNFAISPSLSNRKTDFDKFDQEPRTGGPKSRHEKIFVPPLMNDIRIDLELLNDNQPNKPVDRELAYEGVYYNKPRNPNNVRCHLLEFVGKYKEGLIGLSNPEIRRIFNERLDNASQNYQAVRENYQINFHADSDSSFIPIWKSVLED